MASRAAAACSGSSLLEGKPQFAEAADCCPLGMESVDRLEPAEGAACQDYIAIGSNFGTREDRPNPRLIPISEALATDFEEAYEEAFRRYADDSILEDQMMRPKNAGPSAHDFRNILFKAGREQSWDAAKYLRRIPDPDLPTFGSSPRSNSVRQSRDCQHLDPRSTLTSPGSAEYVSCDWI